MGIVTGIVAGVHRYLIDIGGITSVPCLITSIIAGISAGYINLKVKRAALARRHRRRHAVRIPHHAADRAVGQADRAWVDIVSQIALPMILGTVCIGLIVLLVQSVEDEKR